ncbi:MAG: hypothetical protein EXS15_08820 [Phycisphaerales bacterium]|nr:hypothetical protein [Phycisphaerales bacterium]
MPALQPTSRRATLGFSLVELLLAVFILGIGFIGISALFPAGIAQQRQANDDIIGPIVADNAMALLRTRVRPEWFGTMEEFGQPDQLFPNATSAAPVARARTVVGDWEWKRPGFLFANSGATPINELGAIDVFSALYTSNQLGGVVGSTLNTSMAAVENAGLVGGGAPLFGIPYNRAALDPAYSPVLPLGVSADALPLVLITRDERSYPMGGSSGQLLKKPSHYWECMFRRFAGRIQVAIFVYRVVDSGGEPRVYSPAQGSASMSATIPPLPALATLTGATTWKFGGIDGNPATKSDNSTVPTPIAAATPGSISLEQTWQFPGQWILDEYNTVHRVLTGRKTTRDTIVTLTRPVPAHPPLAVLFGTTTAGGTTMGGIAPDPGARAIWFIPASDSRGFTLVPIFATVQEL